MIYGATGSTNLITIKSFMAENIPIENGLLLLGLALLLVGFGFKVAAMPFHSWSPDAYDGAPTPAVVYMAAAVKAAAFAGIVRVFMLTFENYSADWRPLVYGLAVLSMVGGALIAIVQSTGGILLIQINVRQYCNRNKNIYANWQPQPCGLTTSTMKR